MALTDKLAAIADAIRTKTGKTAPLKLADMPAEILSISGGGGQISATVTVQNAGANANLTARSSEATFSGTTDANGTGTIEISEPGTYVISSNKKGQQRTVDVYSDGAYTLDFNLVLYNAGDQCANITGGWLKRSYRLAGATSAGDATFETNRIYLRAGTGNTNRSIGVGTVNAIDLTGYSQLCITYNSGSSSATSNDNRLYVAIMPEGELNTNNALRITDALGQSQAGTTYKYPMATMNGAGQVAVIHKRNSNTIIFYVQKVWLE